MIIPFSIHINGFNLTSKHELSFVFRYLIFFSFSFIHVSPFFALNWHTVRTTSNLIRSLFYAMINRLYVCMTLSRIIGIYIKNLLMFTSNFTMLLLLFNFIWKFLVTSTIVRIRTSTEKLRHQIESTQIKSIKWTCTKLWPIINKWMHWNVVAFGALNTWQSATFVK